MAVNQRLIEFLGLLALILLCLAIGIFGTFKTKELFAWRMKKIEARNLSKYLPIAESTIRILSMVVIALALYLLSKMPMIYNHCVKPGLSAGN